jgi:hypothetical protein
MLYGGKKVLAKINLCVQDVLAIGTTIMQPQMTMAPANLQHSVVIGY